MYFVCLKWASLFWLYSKFHFSAEEIIFGCVWVGALASPPSNASLPGACMYLLSEHQAICIRFRPKGAVAQRAGLWFGKPRSSAVPRAVAPAAGWHAVSSAANCFQKGGAGAATFKEPGLFSLKAKQVSGRRSLQPAIPKPPPMPTTPSVRLQRSKLPRLTSSRPPSQSPKWTSLSQRQSPKRTQTHLPCSKRPHRPKPPSLRSRPQKSRYAMGLADRHRLRVTDFGGSERRKSCPLARRSALGHWGCTRPCTSSHTPPPTLNNPEDIVPFRDGYSVRAAGGLGFRGAGIIGRGEPPPSPSRAPSLCPATVPLTASASLNGFCNRPQPLSQPPLTARPTTSGPASEVPSLLMHPWGGGGGLGEGCEL